MTSGLLLAAADEPNVTPGLLGFLVVAALGVATWLLLRSMRRQMRKISFDEAETADNAESSRSTDSSKGTGSSKGTEQPAPVVPEQDQPKSDGPPATGSSAR